MAVRRSKSRGRCVCHRSIALYTVCHRHSSRCRDRFGYLRRGEKIIEFALNNNCINSLTNLKEVQREKKMLNSRFDFMGIDEENKKFILEVKSVPLCNNNVAFFPEGYRKKKTDVVSPRALKHIKELQQIKEENPEYRTILCFVIQRSDATSFKISDNDPIYKEAIKEAISKGVQLLAIQIIWNEKGIAIFGGHLPIENN